MKIDVVFTAREADRERIEGKSVVVIDVLRATSVMVTALSLGAEEIRVYERVEDTVAAAGDDDGGVLCGERKGLKIEGFDYGNSPLEYGDEVAGRRMYMTTTNGTRALVRSEAASRVYVGSFLNLEAVAERVVTEGRDLVIVCAGTDGEYTLDDSLCAGVMADRIASMTQTELTDSAISVRLLAGMEPRDVLLGSRHYSYLRKLGYDEDLEYCLERDLYRIVPEYTRGVVRADREDAK